jgi:hypothetical protein
MINVKMHWVGDENGPCGILEGGMMPPEVPAIQFYIFRSMTFRSHSDDFAGLQLSSFYSPVPFLPCCIPYLRPQCRTYIPPPTPPPLPSSAVFPTPPPYPSAIFLPHSHYSSSLFTPSPSSSAVFLPVPRIILL